MPTKKVNKTTIVAKSVSPSPITIKPKEKVGILYFIIPEDQSIDEEHVSLVRKEISNSTASKLYLVIDSTGGVPYSSVRIIRVLRKKFKEIYGVVPHQAMSAATLMLLGTNAIFMSEESQLGPLDLPMEHPVDGSPISALDVMQSLTQLDVTATELAKNIYKELRRGDYGDRICKNKAIELSLSHAEKMVLPLINKIDPYHRQRAVRKLKIGSWYAIDLLLESMMNSFSKAKDAANTFVMSFPDHSYGIFKEDAKYVCGLDIRDSEDLKIWDLLLKETDSHLSTLTTKIVYNEIDL